MPCRDDRDEWPQTEIDSLTRMLCATARYHRGDKLDADQQAALHEAQSWLIKHDEKDRERLEREREAADAQKHRDAAWAKLTPEERRALRLG